MTHTLLDMYDDNAYALSSCVHKLTEPIPNTFIAKDDLLYLFIGSNMLIFLFGDHRKTREITCQGACKEKLQEKDTSMCEM